MAPRGRLWGKEMGIRHQLALLLALLVGASPAFGQAKKVLEGSKLVVTGEVDVATPSAPFTLRTTTGIRLPGVADGSSANIQMRGTSTTGAANGILFTVPSGSDTGTEPVGRIDARTDTGGTIGTRDLFHFTSNGTALIKINRLGDLRVNDGRNISWGHATDESRSASLSTADAFGTWQARGGDGMKFQVEGGHPGTGWNTMLHLDDSGITNIKRIGTWSGVGLGTAVGNTQELAIGQLRCRGIVWTSFGDTGDYAEFFFNSGPGGWVTTRSVSTNMNVAAINTNYYNATNCGNNGVNL